MFVCCECCVLSGRGLCDELITCPEESYRLRCVVVCDLETSRMRRPWPALGRIATAKKKKKNLLSTEYKCNEDVIELLGIADTNTIRNTLSREIIEHLETMWFPINEYMVLFLFENVIYVFLLL